jgi:hypothetical protein
MRKLLPLSLASTLVGGSLMGLSTLGTEPAWALSDQAIVAKLQQVPVFIILNAEGQPLTASAENDAAEEMKLPVVFIDGETAETFLAGAQAEDGSAQVALVDLGTLYEETILDDEAPTPLLYFPIDEEVEAATTLEANFRGVPLVIARQSQPGQLSPPLVAGEDK